MTVLSTIAAIIRRARRLMSCAAALPGALVMMATGYRILLLTRTDRIGHLVGEIDCVLKEERLGRAPARRGVLLAPRDRVANRHIVNYWARHLTVIDSPLLCWALEPIGQFGFASFREDMSGYFTAIGKTAKYNEIFSAWSERPPLLELDPADVERGEAALHELGLPRGARFCAFSAADILLQPRVTPYDAFAIWLHCNRERFGS